MAQKKWLIKAENLFQSEAEVLSFFEGYPKFLFPPLFFYESCCEICTTGEPDYRICVVN